MDSVCRTAERVYYRFEEPDDATLAPPECLDSGLESFNKYPDEAVRETRFWRRQFGQEVTAKQRKFDWYFGFMLPLVCFFFDPFIFRVWGSGEGMLHGFQPFTYILSSASIMALAAWLLWGERLKFLAAPLAGLFFTAAAISFLIGLVLLPFSFFGLLILIGMLGFTPLLTSIVFARNAVRAARTAGLSTDRTTLIHTAALSAVLSLCIPHVASETIKSTIASNSDTAIAADERGAR